MLSESTKEKLKANWGARADGLACFAEARLYDPISSWECYFLAIDPDDEDEAKVIIVDEDKEIWVIQTTLSYLFGRWNEDGELMQLDDSFVRRQSSALFKVLNERNPSGIREIEI